MQTPALTRNPMRMSVKELWAIPLKVRLHMTALKVKINLFGAELAMDYTLLVWVLGIRIAFNGTWMIVCLPWGHDATISGKEDDKSTNTTDAWFWCQIWSILSYEMASRGRVLGSTTFFRFVSRTWDKWSPWDIFPNVLRRHSTLQARGGRAPAKKKKIRNHVR